MDENIDMETDTKKFPKKKWIERKLPLRTILLVPFLVQILVISGLVGYISYRNGQKAVNEVVVQLHSEINARINEYLKTFVETPYHIIQNNAVSINQGLLDYQNQFKMERYFREQINIYKYVSSIYFGNRSGGIANSGREAITGTTYLIGTDAFRSGTLRKYSTTLDGSRARLLLTVPNFDSRSRPWYKAALAKGDSVWSDVYILFTGQDMAISASRPVYGRGRQLLGVVSVDLFLSHISSFLAGMNIGKTGLSYIIDQKGMLIAASTNEMIFTPKRTGETQRRLQAAESSTPLIRKSYEVLVKECGGSGDIKSTKHLDFSSGGNTFFIQVSPLINQSGLEWIIVSVIPESDFMEEISSNNKVTILLILASIVISIIIGYFTSKWISEPVFRLKSSVQAMSSGVWPEIPGESPIAEIDDLKISFFQMSGQMKELIENLTIEIKERKLTEGALRESEEKYRELIQLSNSIILRMDNKGRVTYANDYALNFFGYSRDELLWKSVIGTIVPQTDRSGRNLEEMVDQLVTDPTQFERNENENMRKDGSHVWIVWSNRGIAEENGKIVEVLCIGTDITQRRLAEIEIKKLLGEKEIILHEVHHRIKNNMNTIAGLLYLQSMSIEDATAASALKDAHNRVLSMMLIYDKLFCSADFNSISTVSYFPELIAGIKSTFPDSGNIEIQTRIDDCVLDSNVLVPVGIVINELITNSFKYAFPGKRTGLIEIAFLKTGDKTFSIIFKDNGTGIPESIVLGESKGFGLNLVHLLTQQMQGRVEIIRGEGTTFKIMFTV